MTNEDLAAEFGDWAAEKVLEKTGIAERRIAAPGECASDLGVRAAERLFASEVARRDEIDFLLFCTQSPDYSLPSTACLVQERLALPRHCGALDFNQGCSGYVYGLSLAKGLIDCGTVKNVLLITAETYSKFLNRRDRSVRTIFGDGATATLLSSVPADMPNIGPFVFGTDGRGANQLIVPAGGARQPLSPETSVVMEDASGNWRSQQDLYMNGPEIFSFTIRTVPMAVAELLRKAELTDQDVDYFVFHQANKFMLEHLRKKLEIPVDKFWLNLAESGNTVSSTIPIALESATANGAIKAGDRVMLVGFGVGYSWAAAMMTVAGERGHRV